MFSRRKLSTVRLTRLWVLGLGLSFGGPSTIPWVHGGDSVPDNFPDVVATDLDSLWVFLGNGEGSFRVPVRLFVDVGVEPWHLATGDINGDGFTDVVSANRFGPHVTVHPGRGDGTFEKPSFTATAERPYDVDLGDLDADGDLDLVVTCNNDPGPVEIRYNDGSGGFDDVELLFPAFEEQEPFNSEIADVNDDGLPDLLIVYNDTENLTVLLNRGDRVFEVASRPPLGTDPKPIRSGHVNDDAHLDLVVANYEGGNVMVLLGDGEGNFETRGFYPAGVLPREVTLMDLNGDDLDDVVVAGGRDTNYVVRYLSTEDGSLVDGINIVTGPRPNSVDHGDFDSDGNFDVIVANWSLDDPPLASMSLLLGDGEGSFPKIRDFTPPGGFLKFTAVAVDHFNAKVAPVFEFRRGDVNTDEALNVSDVVHLVQATSTDWSLPCADAADVDDNGELNAWDVLSLLEYLFLNGSEPPPPFVTPGLDPTKDALECNPPQGTYVDDSQNGPLSQGVTAGHPSFAPRTRAQRERPLAPRGLSELRSRPPDTP